MDKIFSLFNGANKFLTNTDRVLIAVSGGIDSIAMSHLYSRIFNHRLDKIAIVHCNFHLRGKDSDDDAAFVKEWAQFLGIKFFEKNFNVEDYCKNHKKTSIQMAARDLRYEYFDQLMESENYQYTALAHHADDQIETFFINLLRGTGYRGLRGMLPQRDKYIRPMLNLYRHDIEEYINEKHLSYREDRTNAENKYLRNNIRHKLIPVLEMISPVAKKTILSTMENLREIETGKLDDFDYLKTYNFNPDQIRQIQRTHRSGAMFFSSTHRLNINRGEYIIDEIAKKSIKRNITITKESVQNDRIIQIDGDIYELSLNIIGSNQDFKQGNNVVFFDLAKLVFPLKLRKIKTGDAFIPFGMINKKRVSRLLIDLKLSQIEKEEQYLLCDAEDNILWVVGRRASALCKCDGSTTDILQVRIT